jgi:hypothetical protein
VNSLISGAESNEHTRGQAECGKESRAHPHGVNRSNPYTVWPESNRDPVAKAIHYSFHLFLVLAQRRPIPRAVLFPAIEPGARSLRLITVEFRRDGLSSIRLFRYLLEGSVSWRAQTRYRIPLVRHSGDRPPVLVGRRIEPAYRTEVLQAVPQTVRTLQNEPRGLGEPPVANFDAGRFSALDLFGCSHLSATVTLFTVKALHESYLAVFSRKTMENALAKANKLVASGRKAVTFQEQNDRLYLGSDSALLGENPTTCGNRRGFDPSLRLSDSQRLA